MGTSLAPQKTARQPGCCRRCDRGAIRARLQECLTCLEALARAVVCEFHGEGSLEHVEEAGNGMDHPFGHRSWRDRQNVRRDFRIWRAGVASGSPAILLESFDTSDSWARSCVVLLG